MEIKLKKVNTGKRLPRIGYISSEPYPHHKTNTQQIVKNVNSLRQSGLDIELIIPRQIRYYFKTNNSLERELLKYYNVEGNLGIKQTGIIPANFLQLEKILHPIFAIFYCLFIRKSSVIYTRNVFTIKLLALLNIRSIFETYQILGEKEPGLMDLLITKAKKDKIAGIVLHSHVAAKALLKKGFPKEKLLVLHNGVDNSDMLPILSKSEARRCLNIDLDGKYVVYTGNMQKNKCIESVIDIAPFVPEITFLLVGGRQNHMEYLREYCEQLDVKNVIFVERQPIAIVSQFLYAADVLIIPPTAAPLEKFGKTVLPFKIFPYLAAGRPIMAPDLSDMREILKNGENSILVEPDNAAQSANAIKELFTNNDFQIRLSENALKTSRSLTWEARAEKFKDWYYKTIDIQ
jgi:glycosyltransferase involved in cell wall biosynthesis